VSNQIDPGKKYTHKKSGATINGITLIKWRMERAQQDAEKEKNPPKEIRLRNRPRPNSRKKRKNKLYLETHRQLTKKLNAGMNMEINPSWRRST